MSGGNYVTTTSVLLEELRNQKIKGSFLNEDSASILLNKFSNLLKECVEPLDPTLIFMLKCERLSEEEQKDFKEVLKIMGLIIEANNVVLDMTIMTSLSTLLKFSSDISLVCVILDFLNHCNVNYSYEPVVDYVKMINEGLAGFNPNTLANTVFTPEFEKSITTFNFKYKSEEGKKVKKLISLDPTDMKNKNLQTIMEEVTKDKNIPESEKIRLFIHLRCIYNCDEHFIRLLCVETKLQALLFFVRVKKIMLKELSEDIFQLLVKPIEALTPIKIVSIKILSELIKLSSSKENQNFLKVIIKEGEGYFYNEYLANIIASSIESLKNLQLGDEPGTSKKINTDGFSYAVALAILQFVSESLCTLEEGRIALICCRIRDGLVKLIKCPGKEEIENIMVATYASRIINALTGYGMTTFRNANLREIVIQRLLNEVKHYDTHQKGERPFPTRSYISATSKCTTTTDDSDSNKIELVEVGKELGKARTDLLIELIKIIKIDGYDPKFKTDKKLEEAVHLIYKKSELGTELQDLVESLIISAELLQHDEHEEKEKPIFLNVTTSYVLNYFGLLGLSQRKRKLD